MARPVPASATMRLSRKPRLNRANHRPVIATMRMATPATDTTR